MESRRDKRKREGKGEKNESKRAKLGKKPNGVDNEPKGRNWTLSIALPGSILSNAQTPQLRTYLAGQIARAACIFEVDEVVIFSDNFSAVPQDNRGLWEPIPRAKVVDDEWDPNLCLARILEYLETPQYLRKDLYPLHKDLAFAGILNPLDAPHHQRQDELTPYREGVVVKRHITSQKDGSLVNAGLLKGVQIKRNLRTGIRVTLKMDQYSTSKKKGHRGTAVSPDEPRTECGTYWGYQVRLAQGLSGVFKDSRFGNYDYKIGTSHRGKVVVDPNGNIFPPRVDQLGEVPSHSGSVVGEKRIEDENEKLKEKSHSEEGSKLLPKKFSHMLVVFGGVEGLEACADLDPSLRNKDVASLFDLYLNTCPHQGSRTIRTEEAILVTMPIIRSRIFKMMGY